MLRECPLTHRCMRGIGVGRGAGRSAMRSVLMTPVRAVFLDRDGTLIEEVGYLDRPERVELYPWSIDAIRALNRAGVRVVMVTNQSGVARGFFDEATVERGPSRTSRRCSRPAARSIDAYYYCPHHPDGKVARVRARLRLPQAGARAGRSRRARARHRSAAVVYRRRPLARRGAGADGRRARHAGADRLRR